MHAMTGITRKLGGALARTLLSANGAMTGDPLADTTSDISVDECALMDRMAMGDLGALETFYYRFHPRLARFFWRLIGRKEGLEEIINDTFLDVWKGARHFREASLVASAWMFGIAYRKALEYLCEDALDDAEIGDALWQWLRAVPPEQRLALLLTYQMGYGLEEIAAISGVSAATVKARMLCAREKLRSLHP